eukprot:TRINITY_DN45771_c0_g1_i1.p1 TRINITY_DN45771_c0_g1~~TRINITY_DN45771_c0_g1_i1.p1  ORF type:complete len:372 (+),score=74.79 TRINITY_DN45771_c0_g1_i1:166-1116(+)
MLEAENPDHVTDPPTAGEDAETHEDDEEDHGDADDHTESEEDEGEAEGAEYEEDEHEGDDDSDGDAEEDDEDHAHVLSREQLTGLHKVLDADGDGHVTLNESLLLIENIRKSLGLRGAREMMARMNISNNGVVALEPFLADVKAGEERSGDDMSELEAVLKEEKDKFAAADKNKDNLLDESELAELISPATESAVINVMAQETLRRKDHDGDGVLSPHEFFDAYLEDGEEGQLTQQEYTDFRLLDTSKDGFLTVDEFRSWESSAFLQENSVKVVFDVADTDRNMRLSHDELIYAAEELSETDSHGMLTEWVDHHEL